MRNTDKIYPMEGVELRSHRDPIFPLVMLVIFLELLTLGLLAENLHLHGFI